MERKHVIQGIILILIGILLCIFFVKNYFEEEKDRDSVKKENTVTIDDVREKEAEQDKTKEESTFQLTGIPDEIYDFLEISKEELEEDLKDWAAINGYPNIAGAAFYEDMSADFVEDKYSFMLQLILEEEQEEEVIVFFDYYKIKGKCEFYIW